MNPELAYGDRALFDSAKSTTYTYYKNKDSILSGTHGPHGAFKLRFNSIAYKLLTDSGRIPKNKKFSEGSFIVKDIYTNGTISLFAYMYKRNGAWIWGEAKPNGEILFGAADGAKTCLGCHSQAGNRDNAVAFQFY